jgi:hypothetical protein
MSDQVKETVKKVFEDLATSLETGRIRLLIPVSKRIFLMSY